jgi:cytochrome c-type biogenesis protein CcmH
MTTFAIIATLLLIAVTALLLPPLWFGRRNPAQAAERKEANLIIFRDQLADLEREKAEGTLAENDFEQAKGELQRRLLEEVEVEPSMADASNAPARKTAIAIIALLPVLALAGYTLLGTPKALDPSQTQPAPKVTPDQILGMVEKLAEKVKSYAETLAMAGDKGLQGKPRQLVEKALKLDPKHPHSLFLAGAAAMEAGENKKGIAYWEALLPEVEPGSEIDLMLRSGITKMKEAK